MSGTPQPQEPGPGLSPVPVIVVLSVWTDDPETGMRVRVTRTSDQGRRRETVWAFSPQEAGNLVRAWLEEAADGP